MKFLMLFFSVLAYVSAGDDTLAPSIIAASSAIAKSGMDMASKMAPGGLSSPMELITGVMQKAAELPQSIMAQSLGEGAPKIAEPMSGIFDILKSFG